MKHLAIFLLGFTAMSLPAASGLKPLLAVPDEIAYQNDFSQDGILPKPQWSIRQGTRWQIEDGVLRGRPSPTEFRTKKKDHFGYEPRASAPVTPREFVAVFSIRFLGGEETPIAPFIEFGHHVCRLRFGSAGTELLVDHESLRVGEAKDFTFKRDHWYHALAELKGDEFVIQFADGPTFYVQHESLAKPAGSGSQGFGVAGTREGTVEIDHITLWSVKPESQPTWKATRAKLPNFTPVAIEKKAPRKQAAK